MSKCPYLQAGFLAFRDQWREETRFLSLRARGAWMELMCELLDPRNKGVLTLPMENYARLLGTELKYTKALLDELANFRVCEVSKEENGAISVKSQDIIREFDLLKQNATRQARFREKGGGDPEKWTAIRIPILVRDKYMCAYCGRRAKTVDHVIPKSKGGTEEPNNLVACCLRCNLQKSSRTIGEAGMCFWEGFNNQILTDSNDSNNAIHNTEVWKLTSKLKSCILLNNPEAKITENQVSSWLTEADLLLRVDHRNYEEAEKILAWAQQDSFWKTNILSMGKFRKQYDQLKLKMEGQHGKGKTPGQRTLENIQRLHEGSD